MADALRLYGLKAVVMAGASGIGEAVSRTLVKHGAAVLALDTEASGVDTVYDSVRDVVGRPLDSRADDLGATVVQSAREVLGGIDIVVNYVELPADGTIDDSNEQALSDLVSARGQMYEAVSDAALPFLKNSPAGRIISIGFVRSTFGIDGENAYEKSHQALAEFSQRLATEHGSYGISANYIQPGAIMTRESRKIFSNQIALRDHCIRRSAARRLGETVDVAKVVLFLASDDAGFVNGAGVMVDGGRAPQE